MLSTRDIKRKIKSIGNTMQIASAMEMVAASKMRKSQLVALNSRPYCERALELLGNLGKRVHHSHHPLLVKRPVKRTLLLVVTSDKGLCGGFNSNVLDKAHEILKKGGEVDVVAVGKKGKDNFLYRKFNVVSEFSGIGDSVDIAETAPIADLLIDLYKSKKYDLVLAIYTNFISTLIQKSVVRQVLPIDFETIKEIIKSIIPQHGRYSELRKEREKVSKHYEYKFEPSTKEILEELLPDLIQIQVYHTILESNASEHSARMVAMKNASDSAKNLIDELRIAYNKIRQAAITKEISEITAGSEALENN
jgi:F-type H+-transporting ATPase subunit gamma